MAEIGLVPTLASETRMALGCCGRMALGCCGRSILPSGWLIVTAFSGRPKWTWMRTKIGMAGRTNTPFDPRDFLANVGKGKTILEFGKGDVIFSQGDAANTIFYI